MTSHRAKLLSSAAMRSDAALREAPASSETAQAPVFVPYSLRRRTALESVARALGDLDGLAALTEVAKRIAAHLGVMRNATEGFGANVLSAALALRHGHEFATYSAATFTTRFSDRHALLAYAVHVRAPTFSARTRAFVPFWPRAQAPRDRAHDSGPRLEAGIESKSAHKSLSVFIRHRTFAVLRARAPRNAFTTRRSRVHSLSVSLIFR